MKARMFVKFAFAALCFALPATAPADLASAGSRKAAPGLTLNDSKGTAIKLSDYKGNVVLLDFWATWCHGCKVEIPWYVEFQNKYKESGLSVIGVAMDDDGWKSVTPFLKEEKINDPIVIGTSELAKPFGVDALPVTLLIDRDGKIADSHTSLVDKTGFEKEIQILLKERASKKSDQ